MIAMYPILFEFGFVTVFSLWFFVALGFTAGSLIFIRLAKRMRLRLNVLSDRSFFLFFTALAASRLTFIIFHPDLFFSPFQARTLLRIFAIWDKGLSFWGAVAGCAAAIWYLSKQRGEENGNSVIRIFDAAVPAVLLGMTFGNIGAFLDGISYGTPSSLPWAIAFRSANVKYIAPIHPTQLYSALYTLALGLALYFLIKKLRSLGANVLPGLVTEAGVFLFSTLKFFEEFFRGDDTVEFFGVRLPQLLAFTAAAGALYLLSRRYSNKNGGDPEHLLQTAVKQLAGKFRSIAKIKHHEMSALNPEKLGTIG